MTIETMKAPSDDRHVRCSGGRNPCSQVAGGISHLIFPFVALTDNVLQRPHASAASRSTEGPMRASKHHSGHNQPLFQPIALFRRRVHTTSSRASASNARLKAPAPLPGYDRQAAASFRRCATCRCRTLEKLGPKRWAPSASKAPRL